MADLVTTITESMVLNGSLRGSSNSITTTGVIDVFERILTCTHSQTTTVAVFNSTPYGADGALDVENCKYFRITNLSTDEDMKVAFVTAATNYQVTVRAGGSHVLFQAEEVMIAEADTTPNFPTLEDLVTVEVRPSATTDVQVRYAILQLVVLIFLMQKFRQQFFNQAFLCHNNFFVIKLLLYFCLDVVCADFSYLQDFQTKSQDL